MTEVALANITGGNSGSGLSSDGLARRFNDYCRASSDWVWEIDGSGRFVFSSERCRDFFGVSPSAVVGTNISSWGRFIDSDQHEIAVDFSSAFSGQLFQTNDHDGPVELLEVAGVPVTDTKTGAFKGMLGTCKDITRQITAEQSMRTANEKLENRIIERTRKLSDLNERLAKEIEYHSNTKKQLNESLVLFQAIAETSPVAMFISNVSDQSIRFSNERASMLLGLTPQELQGRKITEFFVDPQNRRVVRQLVDAARSDGVHQIRYKTAEDTMRWGQLSTHPMKIDDEWVLLTAVMDISELKNADRQLAHRSRLATLGELSASIVHEINQPLSIMGMAIETALEASGENDRLADANTVRSKLMSLLQQQRRLVKISDQMRGYSRNKQPDAEWFSVNQSCEYVVSFLASDFEDRGIHFEIDLPHDSYLIFGAPTALEQVFMNILANARDALEERQQASPDADDLMQVAFVAHYNAEDSEIVFRIWNNGPRIPDSQIDKIFMPFVSGKPADKGTGLGLSICKRLVDGMNGRISVENTADGVAFDIKLPSVARGEKLPDSDASFEAVSPGDQAGPMMASPNDVSTAILLVDDESAILEEMQKYFSDIGYTVETASDGKAALEKVREQTFRAIVTDLQMPRMDGVDFIKTFRMQDADTPIIVVSANALPEGDRSGAFTDVPTLNKPVDLEALHQLIQDVSS